MLRIQILSSWCCCSGRQLDDQRLTTTRYLQNNMKKLMIIQPMCNSQVSVKISSSFSFNNLSLLCLVEIYSLLHKEDAKFNPEHYVIFEYHVIYELFTVDVNNQQCTLNSPKPKFSSDIFFFRFKANRKVIENYPSTTSSL